MKHGDTGSYPRKRVALLITTFTGGFIDAMMECPIISLITYFLFCYTQIGQFIVQGSRGLNGGLNLYSYIPNQLTWINLVGFMPWAWNLNGMGYHLMPRNIANSIRPTDLGTMKNKPTFYPDPYSAGMHEELYRAIKNGTGKNQGSWQGSPDDPFNVTSRNLDSVSHITNDLRFPSTAGILIKMSLLKKHIQNCLRCSY